MLQKCKLNHLKMFGLRFLVVLIVNYALCWSIAAQENAVTVETSSGLILGQKSSTLIQQTTFYAFQGIPYAEPPVGDLRFRAPVPVKNWTGTLNATSEGSKCIQGQNSSIVGSEDCLFLNIFTPKLPSSNERSNSRSTIVWIHGGGFYSGSGNLGLHGSDYFIDQDIIIVSINYRLGVFGFLCTQDKAASGNYGIKDQILALKWIQKNIIHFGGNPKDVTIMGESAGSASVHYLIQSDQAKGLFKGAIAESGSTLNPWTISQNPRDLAFRIGFLNVIFAFDSTYLVNRLRNINAKRLQNSILLPSIVDYIDPLNGLPFSPCIESPSNESVITKRSYEALQNGDFNRVPLLHGFNSLEGREAKHLPWYGYVILGKYNLDITSLAPKDLNTTRQKRREAASQIKSYYFGNGPITEGNSVIYYISDDAFLRGIIETSTLYAKYAPTYLYQFSFTGSATHINFNPEGVSHAEELQFLFNLPEWKQNTTEAFLTIERMVGMWSNFAKTGNPTSKLTRAINVKWPMVSDSDSCHLQYLNINETLTVETNPEEKQMRFWDNIYKVYGSGNYNTY